MGERLPGNVAILPGFVRFDRDLRPSAKLLYAEITALEDYSGYCTASNRYLADLLGLSVSTVSELIRQLTEKEYIFVEVVRDAKGAVTERKIRTQSPIREVYIAIADEPEEADPSPEKSGYPSPEKSGYPSPEKSGYPPPKNRDTLPRKIGIPSPEKSEGLKEIKYISNPIGMDSNYNNIYLPPTIPPKGEVGVTEHPRGKRKEPKKAPDHMPEAFKAFWQAYPRGESKQAAIRAWDCLAPTEEVIRMMADGLQRAKLSELWQRGIGIPYAATWINQRRWLDDVDKLVRAAPEPTAGAGGYWSDDPEAL